MDKDEMPKGMTKLPQDYYEEEEEFINHSDLNYSKFIRDALEKLKGVNVKIQKLEISEQENSPTLVSIIMTVGKSK